MYGVFSYIYPQNYPNVDKYAIHWVFGIGNKQKYPKSWFMCFFLVYLWYFPATLWWIAYDEWRVWEGGWWKSSTLSHRAVRLHPWWKMVKDHKGKNIHQEWGVSKNKGFSSQIIHFNRVFHYKVLSILGVFPLFLETPNGFTTWISLRWLFLGIVPW